MYDFRIPILMYHEITTEENLRKVCNKIKYTYVVTTQKFEEQMRWLAEAGFSTVSLYAVVDIIENKNSLILPKKPIIITFDDGFAGNHQYGFPILKKYGHFAVFFITVNNVGTPYMMGWRQLEELVLDGMSIQSHCMTHPLLGQLDRDGITYELKESKQILQDRLQTSIDFLSLPDGSYNNYYRNVAIETGYRGGCTSKIGLVNPSCDPYLLNRIVVNSKYSLKEFTYIAEARTDFIKKIIFKQIYKGLALRILGEKLYNHLFRIIYRANT